MNSPQSFSRLLLLGLFVLFFQGTPSTDVEGPRNPEPFLRPPFLHVGDTVSVVAISSKLSKKADTSFIRTIASWGLTVKLGEHLFSQEEGWFAGSDRERATDLQRAIDDSSVRAVIFYKGGYGAVRTLDYLDLERLRSHPKWLVGFSDVTVLHQALRKVGVESIHGTMPVLFKTDTLEIDTSTLSLRDALFGKISSYRTPRHVYNRLGRAEGRLVGGNLSLIYALNGTDLDDDLEEPSVLFIEDVGENIYHIDRMMQNLKRSGKLARAKAIVVGYFSKMKGEKEWGADVESLINTYTAPLGIPVIFGFPAGHANPNMSLYMGRQVSVVVTDEDATLEFL